MKNKLEFRIYDPHREMWKESGSTTFQLWEFFRDTASLNTAFGMQYYQWVGKFDSEDVKIFEGDIVSYIVKENCNRAEREVHAVVQWSSKVCAFVMRELFDFNVDNTCVLKIIPNTKSVKIAAKILTIKGRSVPEFSTYGIVYKINVVK